MHLPHRSRLAAALLGLTALGFFSGCFFLNNGPSKTDRSSSVVNYLYPGQSNPLPPTAIPVLRLPLRVGIAFVPSGTGPNDYRPSGISETQKNFLMERVKAEFKAYPFVQSIEIIPSTYLRPQGGFENLDQLRNMLGLDVIALVAYDQVQFTSENFFSLTYWTIVGAYVFNGNRNDTHTLMEAAVYDIASRHLLFRAPGASQVHATTAMVYLADNLRQDSAKGFDTATLELIKNLKLQLEEFRERVKRAPGEVQIENRPGYSGGGSFGAGFAGALVLLGLARGLWRRS